MKKMIVAVVFAGMIFPAFSFAQTAPAGQPAQLQTAYQNIIKQIIALIGEEVAVLQAQLAILNTAPNVPPTVPVATSTTPVISSATTLAPSSTLSVVVVTTTPENPGLTSNTSSGISTTLITQAGKMPLQEIGAITVGASNSGPVELGSLKLTFSGNGYAAGTSTFLNTVFLKDSNNVDVVLSFGALESEDANAGTISWTFPTNTTNPAVISSGQNLTLQLWAATNVIPGIAGTSESLTAVVQNPSDLTFYDGADPAAIAVGQIPLSITAVPIKVAALSWGVGM